MPAQASRSDRRVLGAAAAAACAGDETGAHTTTWLTGSEVRTRVQALSRGLLALLAAEASAELRVALCASGASVDACVRAAPRLAPELRGPAAYTQRWQYVRDSAIADFACVRAGVSSVIIPASWSSAQARRAVQDSHARGLCDARPRSHPEAA
jgi:hypothetical protein